MISQKVGPHWSRVACQSGTAARSPVRSSSNAHSFPKQRSLTMTTFDRSSWRYSRPIQICSRTAELIQSQEKNVELADEALRLAKARLDAGAGVQLDVLNATVQLLTAQSTRLQALFGYNSSLAEFDRATGAQSTYSEMFANLRPRATTTKTYYTGSDVDAMGKPKEAVEERISYYDAKDKLEVSDVQFRRALQPREPRITLSSLSESEGHL